MTNACPGTGQFTASHRGVISSDERGRIRIDNESQCPACEQWVPSKGFMPPPEPGRMWQVQEHDR